MKRVAKFVFLPITLLLSVSKGVLTLIAVASLALSLASVTFSGVFSALSSVVEAVAGPRTVRAGHRGKLDDLNARNVTLADQNNRLNREVGVVRNRVRALNDENRSLRRELANPRVTYRGKDQLARNAVGDTSQRLAKRVTIASSRNVATVFAEALPVVGIGVIVGATAWELRDSCEMMKDLRELDLAFNPERAIDGSEVCGMEVPDRAEVWQRVRESPAEAWNSAREYVPELPGFSETYASAVAEATSFMCWVFPCDTEEVIPE
ncbi:hypothetical protein [Roseovarius sp. D22-M7]|uniref:hypothetical protein n=1 Tax=Roseovarius sp. D22-M7 TaxID=3127116 RepID=UPI00300FAA5E